MPLVRLATLAAVTLLALVACTATTSRTSETAGSPAAAAATVTYKDFTVSPTSVEVRAGETVAWSNGDGTTHTITAGTSGAKSGAFEGRVAGGATATITFATVGTFDYFCEFHVTMRGRVVVR